MRQLPTENKGLHWPEKSLHKLLRYVCCNKRREKDETWIAIIRYDKWSHLKESSGTVPAGYDRKDRTATVPQLGIGQECNASNRRMRCFLKIYSV